MIGYSVYEVFFFGGEGVWFVVMNEYDFYEDVVGCDWDI